MKSARGRSSRPSASGASNRTQKKSRDNEQADRAKRQRAEKAARDRALSKKQAEERAERETTAQIRDLISTRRIERVTTGERFNFEDRGKVRGARRRHARRSENARPLRTRTGRDRR